MELPVSRKTTLYAAAAKTHKIQPHGKSELNLSPSLVQHAGAVWFLSTKTRFFLGFMIDAWRCRH
jgi:hypothetical protein